jgi:hypothetical protein
MSNFHLVIFFSKLFLVTSCLGEKSFVDKINSQESFELEMSNFSISSIWWLAPKDRPWSSFEFKKLESTKAQKIFKTIGESTFGSKFGEYMWNEGSPNIPETMVEGILVLVSDQGDLLGFRSLLHMPTPYTLALIRVSSFDPSKKVLGWDSNIRRGGFKGIRLPKKITVKMLLNNKGKR